MPQDKHPTAQDYRAALAGAYSPRVDAIAWQVESFVVSAQLRLMHKGQPPRSPAALETILMIIEELAREAFGEVEGQEREEVRGAEG